MKPIQSLKSMRLLVGALAVVLLGAAISDPVAAGPIKKAKNFWKDKKNKRSVPNVSMSKTAEDRAVERTPGTTRDVLLITEPKHHADILDGATIAFIEFNHIENKVPAYLSQSQLQGTAEAVLDFGPRKYAERSVYKSDVCARQIEAAIAQHLADLNRYRVVTRDHIQSVVSEQNFANSGRVDSSTSARLGNLVGADVLIYGQVQLCASNDDDFKEFAETIAKASGEKGGFFSNVSGAIQGFAPTKLRSLVFAQIQLIEAQTGRQIFTTSLLGEFKETQTVLDFKMEPEELVYWAADDLANSFIDKFLSRPVARYMDLYVDSLWDFETGVDLIQLGNCERAEHHFAEIYRQHRHQMSEADLSRLMYNHGISLMCANRPEDALDRLWASLRLSNSQAVFDAITFTSETIDRGWHLRSEQDPIIKLVEDRMYPITEASNDLSEEEVLDQAFDVEGPR